MNRRRLDGEAIRDAILSVAGVLNPKAGGPSVFPELPAEMKASAGLAGLADPAERNRRSVYVYVKRNLRYPLFAAFDAPDRERDLLRRFETTTAPQALMLLNDKLYAEHARRFADRVAPEAGADPDAAIERRTSWPCPAGPPAKSERRPRRSSKRRQRRPAGRRRRSPTSVTPC